MYSNPGLVKLRNALRKVGILRLIQTSPVYRLINQGYESRFDAVMMESLKPGMCVFDIGANVGYYTMKFAEKVGRDGHVHAFEPVPASAAAITQLVSTYPSITVHQCAMADHPGELIMDAATDSTSPTNKVVIGNSSEVAHGIKVPVETIDAIAQRVGLPNAIKIDVEGYEFNVLKGGQNSLLAPELQHLFVEIHFSLLDQRGLANAPSDIQKMLEDAGFRVTYVDFSHIHAQRS